MSQIYFCDLHNPWQRGNNENINGVIRQYLPKGTDLSVHSHEEFDAVALQLNMHPRKRFDFKCLIEVMAEVMPAAIAMQHTAPASSQKPCWMSAPASALTRIKSMLRLTIGITVLLTAINAFAKAPIEEDFRCLTTEGPNPIKLEFRVLSDPGSSWVGGYIKYRKSNTVIPLVLKSTEVTDKPQGHPWDYTDVWVEVYDGQITGEYEVMHQGALINSFVYRNRKSGKQYSFEMDIDDRDIDIDSGVCTWK